MGSSPSQTQRSEQTSSSSATLPRNQQQNVDLLMQGARDFYNTGGPQFYGGQTYAGPSAGELLGRQQATNYATGAGQQYVDAAQAGDKFWLNPENIFQPQNIPGFRQSEDYVTNQLTRNLTENILPELRSGSVAQGALGGSRQGIGEGLGIDRTSQQIAGALSGMEMGAYNSGLNMYNQAANRAPAMFDLGLQPANVLNQVGSAERADTQMGIDEDVARFNFEQMAPYFNLDMLKQLTGMFGQYGANTSGTESGRSHTSTSAGSGQMIQQGIGAAVTAIAAIYSHSSLKTEIVPVEPVLPKLQKLGLYTWRYKEGGPKHIGPMAEEFNETFGVGDGVTLNIFDLLGVLLGAVKELSLQGAT